MATANRTPGECRRVVDEPSTSNAGLAHRGHVGVVLAITDSVSTTNSGVQIFGQADTDLLYQTGFAGEGQAVGVDALIHFQKGGFDHFGGQCHFAWQVTENLRSGNAGIGFAGCFVILVGR